MFSIIVPTYNEADYLPEGLAAIEKAAERLGEPVEIVVADNQSTDTTRDIAAAHGARVIEVEPRCIATVRNAGARAATGDRLVFVDADSRMDERMLLEVKRILDSGRYVGGGVLNMQPDRWSWGIGATFAVFYASAWLARVSGGLFYTTREAFEAIDGFNEARLTLEDLDFAYRLRRYGRKQGLRFCNLRSARLITSARKFDTLGDWYVFRSPHKVIRAFFNDAGVADEIWYKPKR